MEAFGISVSASKATRLFYMQSHLESPQSTQEHLHVRIPSPTHVPNAF